MEITIKTPSPLEVCDMISELNKSKADNLMYTENMLQLTSNGAPIGEVVTFTGGGAPGTKGDPGKSAYQSAQDGGYTGTEQEYNTIFASIGSINAALNAILEV